MKKIVSVFGNELEKIDAAAIKILPILQKSFPEIEFKVEDPTETIKPYGEPWIIIDTALGIDKVMMIESLDKLEYVGGSSVHDFDVYMELRLRAKIGELPAINIILVPNAIETELNKVADEVAHELHHLLKHKHQH